jgi:4-amino-4-deoxy-L-arabinose transferase-like glycosyltransferase
MPTPSSRRTARAPAERTILALILVAFVLLGATYALVTPPFEASDELWHYPMVRHLAAGNPLPVQVFDPAQAGPWNQEASQPPLYYYLGAALTFWIDTSDMETVRWLNPHVDNGVITADGNTNLAIHDPAVSPWRGTLLAVRIVRLASVLLGAATVYLTYRIARLVAPQRPAVYLGAAAVNAFTPMFLFISGAVNNDNLALPLASLAVLLLMQTVVQRRASPRRWLLIGAVTGLAVLTKEGTLGLLPLAWGTAVVARWQQSDTPGRWRSLPRWLLRATLDFALLMLPVLLIAGWWYLRNLRLYGDILGWNAFIAVLGERSQPASLAQLWDEREGFLASYWGLFGGVNIPMAGWIYTVLNALLVLAIPGFLLYLLRHPISQRNRMSLLETVHGLVVRHFPLLVSLLFSAAVLYGLVNWATTTWSSQGRLAFTAISTLTTLFLLGLAGWLPRRPANLVAGAVALFLLAVAAAAPFLWIRPAYAVQPAARVETLQPLGASFGDQMRLLAFDVAAMQPLYPGDHVEITLAWEALAPMDRDWSVFVHLNDPVLETPLAQRDMYPGQGLLPTRLLRPGELVVDRYRLRVPSTAPAPAELEVVAGLYDYHSPTGERLPAAQGDTVHLSTLALAAAPGSYPNPVSHNFGGELELVGHHAEPRRVAPGDTVILSLYWRALRNVGHDYTLFAQLLDDDTTRWAASDIGVSEDGLTTSQWSPGEVRAVEMLLRLEPDTPPGVYPIVVGAYRTLDDGGWRRLQLVEEGRITMDDHLRLVLVRVE